MIGRWPSHSMVLLDAHDPVRRGGTGTTVDWSRAAAVAARRRIVLAGGLTPANVGDAIDRVRPFGIDVSSGVETSPGVKDRGKLRALFDVVNGRTSTQRTLWAQD
jgi:phosphoribosylanthranilate isomerase